VIDLQRAGQFFQFQPMTRTFVRRGQPHLAVYIAARDAANPLQKGRSIQAGIQYGVT
jgi:hypothetical protein